MLGIMLATVVVVVVSMLPEFYVDVDPPTSLIFLETAFVVWNQLYHTVWVH